MDYNAITKNSKIKVRSPYSKRIRTVIVRRVIETGKKWEVTNAGIVWSGDIEEVVRYGKGNVAKSASQA